MEPTAIPNVFVKVIKGRKMLFTKNLVQGTYLQRDKLMIENGVEYRYWDAMRSKLAAAIVKGLNPRGLTTAISVLYLGASSGTTISYLSDILEAEGMIFALDHAPKPIRSLLFLAEQRPNIAPILADAGKPESYYAQVLPADMLYQDIAQRNQIEIFLKNCRIYLKPKGFAYLCIKSRSIDVAANPQKIYNDAIKTINQELNVLDVLHLDPFQKDHAMIVCQRK